MTVVGESRDSGIHPSTVCVVCVYCVVVPNKTIYIPVGDIPIWKRAETRAWEQHLTLSKLIVHLLKEHLDQAGPQSPVDPR